MSPLLLSFVDLFGLALQNSRGAELFITISGFYGLAEIKAELKRQ